MPVVEMMKRGGFTLCGARALEQPVVVVTDDVASECDDCPLADACPTLACMTTSLKSSGRVYGILSVSIPAKVASDADEQSLLSEVADDIAFGLHRIELEERRRQAEDALAESEGRYRSVFENTGTATVIIEEDATISMTNTEFDKLCGYSKEEVEGKKSWTEFVVEEDLERMKKYHAERRKKGGKSPTEYEFRFVDKEGNIKNILLNIGLLPGAKRGVASLMDITSHKRAEDALQREKDFAESLIATAQTIVLVLDTEGMIVRFNPYMEAISGYRLEEVQGRDWFTTFLPKRDQDQVRELFLKAVGNIQTDGNVNPIVTKDGREREIEWHDKTLKDADGNIVGLLAVGQDITERKAAEERIEHLNSVLKAIRNVNQLIVTEKDRDSLLKNACDILIEARGYEAVCLGHLSDGETFDRVVGSGFGEDVDRFCESVMGGNHPLCIEKTLAGKDMVVLMNKPGECGDCTFKGAGAGSETAVIRIEREGKLFGLLVISLAADVTLDDEEEGVLLEVASDIALALHNMDVEEARKIAEDQIKASLKEKEVLLREIHHRVKNNLQVVSSLLDMRARDSTNKDTIDALTESKDRINAMALIHTQLYEGSDLSEINMNMFANSLLVQVFQSYPAQDATITPIVSVADYPFPISMAVPAWVDLK